VSAMCPAGQKLSKLRMGRTTGLVDGNKIGLCSIKGKKWQGSAQQREKFLSFKGKGKPKIMICEFLNGGFTGGIIGSEKASGGRAIPGGQGGVREAVKNPEKITE